MIEVRAATEQESTAWQDDWRRLESWYGRQDVTAAWASQQVEHRLASHPRASAASTFAVTSGGLWWGCWRP